MAITPGIVIIVASRVQLKVVDVGYLLPCSLWRCWRSMYLILWCLYSAEQLETWLRAPQGRILPPNQVPLFYLHMYVERSQSEFHLMHVRGVRLLCELKRISSLCHTHISSSLQHDLRIFGIDALLTYTRGMQIHYTQPGLEAIWLQYSEVE